MKLAMMMIWIWGCLQGLGYSESIIFYISCWGRDRRGIVIQHPDLQCSYPAICVSHIAVNILPVQKGSTSRGTAAHTFCTIQYMQ